MSLFFSYKISPVFLSINIAASQCGSGNSSFFSSPVFVSEVADDAAADGDADGVGDDFGDPDGLGDGVDVGFADIVGEGDAVGNAVGDGEGADIAICPNIMHVIKADIIIFFIDPAPVYIFLFCSNFLPFTNTVTANLGRAVILPILEGCFSSL